MEKNKNKKISKIAIISTFSAVTLLLILLYLITAFAPKIFDAVFKKEEVISPEDFVLDVVFYEENYDENIFENQEYTDLICNGILIYDDKSGTKVNLFIEDSTGSEEADCVWNMVKSVINGNATEYNSYFSDTYFETHSPKQRFTMQKIYGGSLSLFSVEEAEEGNENYTKYTYELSYYIYENNGSFRKDIFDDGQRRQYISVSQNNSSGKYLIDGIGYEVVIKN